MMLGDPARLLELADIARKAGTAGQLNVLEWGSGESTAVLFAEICRRESGRLVTIDHDSSYQAQVLAGLAGRSGLIPFVADLAGNLDSSSAEPNYATLPMTLLRGWDLIVIDGRRRLECALVASAISSRRGRADPGRRGAGGRRAEDDPDPRGGWLLRQGPGDLLLLAREGQDLGRREGGSA